MAAIFIALGGIIITVWLLTGKCRLEEELPDQIERKFFKLLEVLEDENAYLVRIEIDGKQEWAKIPRNRTKIHYLDEKTQYQRFDIIETTSYYIEKRCFRENRKLCSIETSYKIFVSPDSYFPKEF